MMNVDNQNHTLGLKLHYGSLITTRPSVVPLVKNPHFSWIWKIARSGLNQETRRNGLLCYELPLVDNFPWILIGWLTSWRSASLLVWWTWHECLSTIGVSKKRFPKAQCKQTLEKDLHPLNFPHITSNYDINGCAQSLGARRDHIHMCKLRNILMGMFDSQLIFCVILQIYIYLFQ